MQESKSRFADRLAAGAPRWVFLVWLWGSVLGLLMEAANPPSAVLNAMDTVFFALPTAASLYLLSLNLLIAGLTAVVTTTIATWALLRYAPRVVRWPVAIPCMLAWLVLSFLVKMHAIFTLVLPHRAFDLALFLKVLLSTFTPQP